MTSKTYSVTEAAKEAHVSVWTVYTAIRRARLKAKGKYRRQIKEKDLRQWIDDEARLTFHQPKT